MEKHTTVLRHTNKQHQAMNSVLNKLGKKPPILWPKMNSNEKWVNYQKEDFVRALYLPNVNC